MGTLKVTSAPLAIFQAYVGPSCTLRSAHALFALHSFGELSAPDNIKVVGLGLSAPKKPCNTQEHNQTSLTEPANHLSHPNGGCPAMTSHFCVDSGGAQANKIHQ